MNSRLFPQGSITIPESEIHAEFRRLCNLFNAIQPRVALVDRLHVQRHDLTVLEAQLARAQAVFMDASGDPAIEAAQREVQSLIAAVNHCKAEIARLEALCNEPIII